MKVSRSGYYKWAQAQHKRDCGEDRGQNYVDALDRQIKKMWDESDEVYGSPPITVALADDGFIVDRRRVLGWVMDSVQTTDVVERALRMAHMLRGEVPDGLVFHADRGC
ncbi:hypothetical protein [Rothia sp. 32237D007AR]